MTHDIRELLELAAKACGYEIQWDHFTNLPMMLTDSGADVRTWAPHIDDGDGARMEAQLAISLHIADGAVYASCRTASGTLMTCEKRADHNGNRQAARRMASLRVAAELGRRMKA